MIDPALNELARQAQHDLSRRNQTQSLAAIRASVLPWLRATLDKAEAMIKSLDRKTAHYGALDDMRISLYASILLVEDEEGQE